MKYSILLFTNLFTIILFSACSGLISTRKDCNVFDAMRDEANYKLGYKFLSFPYRIVGSGESYNYNSYKIDKLEIFVPLDTVYSFYGNPICEKIVSDDEHNVKYKEIYYNGIKFVGNKYPSGKHFILKRIYTLRKDIFTPDSLHCGMNLQQVKDIYPNIKLTCHADCETTGLLNIYYKKLGVTLRIVFVDNEVWTIIIDGMEG